MSAPFAIALGHSPAAVLEQLQQELDKAVAELDVHPAQQQHLFDRYLDNFLIGYPELWPLVGADSTRFLGAPMIRYCEGSGCFADKLVMSGNAGKTLIRNGGEANGREIADLILDYLQSLDLGVLDAQHLLLDGSRSDAWLDRCQNLEEHLVILERLLSYGITHPAMKRIEGLAGKLSQDGRQSAIKEYLRHGSAVAKKLAKGIIAIDPGLHDWALGQCLGYSPVSRLAQIRALTAEQVGRLPLMIRRKILEDDMGV